MNLRYYRRLNLNVSCLNLKFSFVYVFLNNFNFFNYFFLFNFFFLDYLIKLILVLRLVLLNNLNVLVLFMLKKKRKNLYYCEDVSFFNHYSIKKILNNYFYLFKDFEKKIDYWVTGDKVDFIILYNFDQSSFFLKKLKTYNFPVINFNFFNFDYPVFLNNFFFFNFFLFLFTEHKASVFIKKNH